MSSGIGSESARIVYRIHGMMSPQYDGHSRSPPLSPMIAILLLLLGRGRGRLVLLHDALQVRVPEQALWVKLLTQSDKVEPLRVTRRTLLERPVVCLSPVRTAA